MPLDKSADEDIPYKSVNRFEVLATLESLTIRDNDTHEDASVPVDQSQPNLKARDLASSKLPELEDDPLFRLLRIHQLLRVRQNTSTVTQMLT